MRKKKQESAMTQVPSSPTPEPPEPLQSLIPSQSDDFEGGAFLKTSITEFNNNMYVVIRESMVHRISEDTGLLSFVHMVDETDASLVVWDDLETSLPPHMYKVSRMSMGVDEGLEFRLSSRSPREWMGNNENVRADIVNKISSGKTLLEISQMAMYPPLKVIRSWMKRDAQFTSSIEEALTSVGQLMHDRALTEAKQASDMDPKATKALIDALKWSAAVANPERFNPTKKDEVQAPTTYNVVINTGIPMVSHDRAVAIDVTPKPSQAKALQEEET